MYLGLDLGTSSLKALLIDESQTVIGSAEAALSVQRPHAGWSEQDPGDWIVAAGKAVARLRHAHGDVFGNLCAIGLSGHMHGATLLDDALQVLRPCILWNDTRSHAEAAALDADPQFRRKTGNIVFPGFTAPKLAWVRAQEPTLFNKVHKVLLPKDYLRLWLTGETISDMSDCAGTGWMDVGGRCFDDDLLAATGLERSHMPELVEGCVPGGVLRAQIAAELGLRPGIVVAGGGGDNAASAVGMGVVQTGSAFLSLGTSGVLFAATDSFRPNPDSAIHTFCHALTGKWHQMGVILSATDALNWYARLTGVTAKALSDELGTQLHAPSGATFLPYLSGERTPHNDAAIRGAFAGLDHNAGRPELTRAVMEGVAFAFRDCRDGLAAAGTRPERYMAVGGGARSHYWLALMATVLGTPIDVPADGEFGAAFGAARLAMMAANASGADTICTPPPVTRTISPDTALEPAFNDAYHAYRELYPALSTWRR